MIITTQVAVDNHRAMPTPEVHAKEDELLSAVKSGRESEVGPLLMSGSRLDDRDGEGRTVFHWACQYGNLNMLCLLVSHLPRTHSSPLPSSSSSSSLTPPEGEGGRVCLACRRSAQERSSADGGVQSESRDQDGRVSFHERGKDGPASDSDNDNSNSHIADGDRVANEGHNIGDGGGDVQSSSLEPRKASEGRDRVCTCNSTNSRLVSRHVINAQDVKGQTALLVACNYRRCDAASLLVTLSCCDVNLADAAGNTPLHRAVHNDLETLACLLCEAGADVRAVNRQLQTPLHEAIRAANYTVVRRLLARGCDVNAVTRSAAAPTPFLTAVFYHKIAARASDYASFLDPTLRLLIESGCRLSQGDYQWTPLSAAVDIDNSFIASLLLFNGCLVQKSGPGGRSLLVEAFTHCEAYVTRLLVLCGYQPSLEEVQTCSRRIPAFSPLFYRISRSECAAMKSKSQLLAWLRRRATGDPVPSLMELSRAGVRRALNFATGDTSILSLIPKLPVPSVLRQYVALIDFTSDQLMRHPPLY